MTHFQQRRPKLKPMRVPTPSILPGRHDPAELSSHSMESPSPLRRLMQYYSKSRKSVGKFFGHLDAEAAEDGERPRGNRSLFDPSVDSSPPAPKRGPRMSVTWKSSPELLSRQAKKQEASSTRDSIASQRVLRQSRSLPSIPTSPPAILGPRRHMLLPTPTALLDPAEPRSPPPRLSQTRSLPAMTSPTAILGPRRHMQIPTPTAIRSPHEGTSADGRLFLPLGLIDDDLRATSGENNFLQTSYQPSELHQIVIFNCPLLCTTSRRIPASASANQGPEHGDLILL